MIARAPLALIYLSRVCFLFLGCCFGNHPLMSDLLRTSGRRKSPCIHPSAIPERIARRVADVRRDGVVCPARADRPSAEYGT